MANGRLRKAVDRSIKSGIESGMIDMEKDSATIGMLRYMADCLDSDPGDKTMLRYITPSSFLAYCEKLGFLPELGGENKAATKSQIVKLVGNSKWKKQA